MLAATQQDREKMVQIGGAVRPSTTLAWDPAEAGSVAGYKIYWRETTAPQWTDFRYVGNVSEYTRDRALAR